MADFDYTRYLRERRLFNLNDNRPQLLKEDDRIGFETFHWSDWEDTEFLRKEPNQAFDRKRDLLYVAAFDFLQFPVIERMARERGLKDVVFYDREMPLDDRNPSSYIMVLGAEMDGPMENRMPYLLFALELYFTDHGPAGHTDGADLLNGGLIEQLTHINVYDLHRQKNKGTLDKFLQGTRVFAEYVCQKAPHLVEHTYAIYGTNDQYISGRVICSIASSDTTWNNFFYGLMGDVQDNTDLFETKSARRRKRFGISEGTLDKIDGLLGVDFAGSNAKYLSVGRCEDFEGLQYDVMNSTPNDVTLFAEESDRGYEIYVRRNHLKSIAHAYVLGTQGALEMYAPFTEEIADMLQRSPRVAQAFYNAGVSEEELGSIKTRGHGNDTGYL